MDFSGMLIARIKVSRLTALIPKCFPALFIAKLSLVLYTS